MANTRAQKTAQNLSTLTTAGDIAYASAAGTPARLGIGSSAQVLTVAAGVPSWATAASGGKVLQVVSATTTTATTTTSGTYADTTLTASITPTLNTSKVLVMISQHMEAAGTSGDAIIGYSLVRDATNLFADTYSILYNMGSTNKGGGRQPIIYMDSPATTSSTTYKTQFKRTSASGTQTAQGNSAPSMITLMEIGV